jgi:hypothetical protein
MHLKRSYKFIIQKFDIGVDLFREYGWMKFFGKIIPWLFRRRYIFLSGPTNHPISFLQAEIPFRLELAKQRDLKYLIKLRPHFYELRQIQERIKQGHLCFLGWSRNEPMHIRWVFVCSRFLPYLHRTIRLTPGEVYTDEAYTARDFRHKGVYSYAGCLLRKFLKDMGYRRIVLALPAWSMFLMNTAESFRMEKIGEGGYWNLFGCKKYFWKGTAWKQNNGKIFIAQK